MYQTTESSAATTMTLDVLIPSVSLRVPPSLGTTWYTDASTDNEASEMLPDVHARVNVERLP